MPSAWTNVDANFPTITQDGEPREQIMQLFNYMYSLTEQLKYTLENLDKENWNAAGLEKFSAEFTDGINKLNGASERAFSLINKLSGRVGKTEKQGGELAEAVDGLNATLKLLGERLTLIAGDSAAMTIGGSGKRVNLNGDIYINGVKQ